MPFLYDRDRDEVHYRHWGERAEELYVGYETEGGEDR